MRFKKRFRGNVFALKPQHQGTSQEIDLETTIPLREGGRVDDGLAVEGLLPLEGGQPVQEILDAKVVARKGSVSQCMTLEVSHNFVARTALVLNSIQ